MTHRRIPIVMMISLSIGLIACGDDDVGSPARSSTLPPVVDGASPGYEHPTGADDVVVGYAEVGGFTTREFAFQQTPRVLVAGDGRVFSPGAQIEIYPGPLLPAVQVQPITEDGIQSILAEADAAGLLSDVDYSTETNIADATTATVTIAADGMTWVHEAYALDAGGPGAADPLPERRALADFIALLTDRFGAAGTDTVGQATLHEPDSYQIEALEIDDLDAYGTADIDPVVVDWPAATSVRLADASSCVDVPAAEVGEILVSANQLTFFEDAGITYQLFARPALPGISC